MNIDIQNSTIFKKLFVNYIVPINRTLGIKLKTMEENETYIINHLEKNGKCEIELVSTVTDSKGDTVAELTALYHIKRLRRKL